MAGNGRMTRTLARHQSAYEDAARDIQKRINTCHDVSGDAKDFFEEFRLDAGDNSQRKTQLVAQNHHHHQCYQHGNITHLNQHAAILNAEMSEWTNIMRGYTIATEESEWAANMRCQHDDFFMQAPNSTSYFENPSFTTRTPSTVFSQHPTRLAPTGSATSQPTLTTITKTLPPSQPHRTPPMVQLLQGYLDRPSMQAKAADRRHHADKTAIHGQLQNLLLHKRHHVIYAFVTLQLKSPLSAIPL
ncbi:hypothetical protein AAVH_13609 [Aphelenchoides avenae]|nr:hypothetical protein AAVH_13609 [Aphelenchus avenae]